MLGKGGKGGSELFSKFADVDFLPAGREGRDFRG